MLRFLLRARAFALLAAFASCAAVRSTPAIDAGLEVYPCATQPIQLQRGGQLVQVRPLKTVRTLSKRKAVADRLIVVFRADAPDPDQVTAHARAGKLGAGLAKPVLKVGRKAVLVDVTGAKSLEEAARAYKADPNVLHAIGSCMRSKFPTTRRSAASGG